MVRNALVTLVALTLLGAAFAAKTKGAAGSEAVSILEKRCLQCHSEQLKMSGLRLTSRELLMTGGTRGPAIEPGNAGKSLLIAAVSHSGKLLMPPGEQIPQPEIEILRAWVDQGAPWPERDAGKVDSEWWAFRTPQRPPVPQLPGVPLPGVPLPGVSELPGGPNDDAAPAAIDAFLLAKLRGAGLEPAAEAGRLTLLRRACFDLLGLPPTAEQITTFLADTAPGSWQRLIDSLLESPRYGEKWGQHWLDLVRYGDTSGFEQDPYILEAWRYRDYVVKSFNDDKPYDRFVQEQLAADELWPEDSEARTGTGYYRVGTNRDMLFKVEDQNRVEKLTDYVDTTSQVFLGLTVGCARCHDHKFDPIPQRDFYRLQAVFAPAINDRVFLEYNSARLYDIAANSREFRLRQIGDQLAAMLRPVRERLRQERIAPLPADTRAAFDLKPEERSEQQQALVAKTEPAIRVNDDEVRDALSNADAEALRGIEKSLVSMFTGYSAPPMAPGVIDVGREAPRTFLAIRGNWQQPGEEVSPGFPSCVGGGDVPQPELHATGTGRRKALAEWITGEANPLFARVMVNRIWQHHFGAGLLKSSSDFGVRAGQPTHPELLDWLALEFRGRGYSIKQMHRLMMNSSAYRRSSATTPAAQQRDPLNELLSHFGRRQLSAEEIRDAVLQVSGTLNLKMGGVPVVPPLEKEELHGIIGRPESAWRVSPDPAEHTRRSIYVLRRRTFQQPMMAAFDAPDGVLSCSRRNESTTAPQALALLNSGFMLRQSEAAASHIHDVDGAFQRILGRRPSAAEQTAAAEFLERQTARLGSPGAALAELTRGLMNSNEFLYVD
jgi:hypothetical protein